MLICFKIPMALPKLFTILLNLNNFIIQLLTLRLHEIHCFVDDISAFRFKTSLDICCAKFSVSRYKGTDCIYMLKTEQD